MKNTDENELEDENKNTDKNVKLIMKIIHISEQMKEINNFFIDDLKNSFSMKLDNFTISQEIKNKLDLNVIQSKIDLFKLMMCENVELYEVIKICFQDILMELCDHNRIVDYIDSSTYESKRIEYCDKCELTKNIELINI